MVISTQEQSTGNLPAALSVDLKEVAAPALALVESANSLEEIESNEAYMAADTLVGNLRKERKGIKGFIEAFFEPHVKRAKAAHQGLCDDRTAYVEKHDAPLATAEQRVLGLMGWYREKVEAERKRLQAEADQKAREEREAAAKKADEDRKAQLARDEEDRLARAAALEAEGKAEEAQRVISAPPPPPAPLAPPPFQPREMVQAAFIPKTKSSGSRENWVYEGTDKMELIRAAAQNEAYAQYLTFNEATLKAFAKSAKGEARCPGVKFFDKPISVVR